MLCPLCVLRRDEIVCHVGRMIASSFVLGSWSHFGALACIVFLGYLYMARVRCLSERGKKLAARWLGVLCLCTYVLSLVAKATADSCISWQECLPLHFCAWMELACFFALWFRRSWMCALAYFGVLAASVQGLVTPTLSSDFPSVSYFAFFLSHGVILVAALALPIAFGWRARRNDPWRVQLLGIAYLVCMVPVNWWLGTNYGFTREAPVAGSILDYMGVPPWYLLSMQVPLALLLYLLYLPVKNR